jgi:hypothetical protein
MIMYHNLYFSKKEKCFVNICVSHEYEIMSEFHKELGEMIYMLRDVATIMDDTGKDKNIKPLPPMNEEKVQKRLDELNNECHYDLIPINNWSKIKITSFTKNKKIKYRNIEKATKLVYNEIGNKIKREILKNG